MPTTIQTKRCSKCKHEYPATVDYFYKHPEGQDGLTGRCKQCLRKYQKQCGKRYYQQHKEQFREYSKRDYTKHKMKRAQRKKQYNKEHKIELGQHNKQWYQEHRTECITKQKQYYKTIQGCLRSVWRHMRQRCNNPKRSDYKYYGGRGIEVKFVSFEDFYDYVVNGLKAEPRGLTIDRINNDGDYERGNIRFVTQAENNRNKRKKYLT